MELANLLIELSKAYFKQLGQEKNAPTKKADAEKQKHVSVHQCENCLTVYDDEIGDARYGIMPNTKFEDVSESYICPVCSAGKTSFKPILLKLE